MAQHARRDDSARIACPRCRSNNFLGQTHCWQCRSPLPPPEAMSGYAPPQAVSAPVWTAPSLSRRARNPLPLIFVSLLVLCGVLVFTITRRSKPGETSPHASRLPDRENRSQREESGTPEKVWDVGPITEPSAKPEYDPVAEQARRAVERASQELDLPPPNAARDADGRIRLRGGGSVRQEEWDRARRKVQESPYLREPPMPPPF